MKNFLFLALITLMAMPTRAQNFKTFQDIASGLVIVHEIDNEGPRYTAKLQVNH